MTTRDNRRSKQISEKSVQGALLSRIIGHWVLFLTATGLYLAIIERLSGDPESFWKNLQYRHGPTLLAVLVLSPIMLRDICKLSNRFAGPIVRLRRGLRELAAGKDVGPMKFRDRDFWQDLAGEFNLVAQRMRETRNSVNTPTAPPSVVNVPRAAGTTSEGTRDAVAG